LQIKKAFQKKMKKHALLLFVVVFTFCSAVIQGQDLSQLENIDINAVSDDQIASYWAKIKKGGYTMAQVEVLGKAKGISATKIAAFKRRVSSLGTMEFKENKEVSVDGETFLKDDPFGMKAGEFAAEGIEENLLFGYDFFRNSKVSFAPSVNIAVPKNYQIGPGDEIMIDLWGASEVTYKAVVNNSGSIKINGIGFIFINGFTLEDATSKIISKLKNKHAGIGAANTSYNKISTNVSVSKIRTVQVNIIGAVKVPGTYALNSLSTVLNALYVAGGPTKAGTFRAVQLVRANKVVATLDVYEYLLSGTQKGNLKLQDQDVLLVSPYKNQISVEGAVKRAGIYEVKEGESLADLIQYFGGFTPKAYTSLLVIERLNGARKEVREVSLEDASRFSMQAGDKLVVQEILETYENKIAIGGAVYRPGKFELFANTTLKNLLEKAEGITPEAFLTRGLLVRTYDDTHKENIPFSVTTILNGETSILLQDRDSVHVFNKKELREERTIRIAGAVNIPRTIDFIDQLQIEDVIAMSGGLQPGADPEVISVSRRLKDGSFKTLSKIFTISSGANLALNTGVPFYLEPFDMINVRFAKGYRVQESVVVKGEVKYQGDYVLESKNERISDLIKRAGGLTDFADIKGAALIRKIKEKKNKEILKNIAKSEGDNLDVEALQEMDETVTDFKIGIDLVSILSNKGSEIDMFLREGDVLMIPAKSQTVEVSGIVLRPSLVLFKEGQALKTYIEKSGGFGETAKKSKIYVSYANGDIKTVRNFFFYKRYPKLAPGATIFVPAKPEKEKMSTAEILGITSSIATLGILIQTMLR
jgi:protein involved in polysaccharide export with SLBB domain